MATAYFYDVGSGDLNDSANWWDDASHTTPFSGGIPGGGDIAYLDSDATSNSGITALGAWINNVAVSNVCSTGISCGSVSVTSSAFDGTVTVQLDMYGSASAGGSCVINCSGTVTLNGSSTVSGIGSASMASLAVNGTASWTNGITSCGTIDVASGATCTGTITCTGAVTSAGTIGGTINAGSSNITITGSGSISNSSTLTCGTLTTSSGSSGSGLTVYAAYYNIDGTTNITGGTITTDVTLAGSSAVAGITGTIGALSLAGGTTFSGDITSITSISMTCSSNGFGVTLTHATCSIGSVNITKGYIITSAAATVSGTFDLGQGEITGGTWNVGVIQSSSSCAISGGTLNVSTQMNFSGGMNASSCTINISSGASVTWSGGTITSCGGTWVAGDCYVNAATFTGFTVTSTGNLTVAGTWNNNVGTITGDLTVGGNFTGNVTMAGSANVYVNSYGTISSGSALGTIASMNIATNGTVNGISFSTNAMSVTGTGTVTGSTFTTDGLTVTGTTSSITGNTITLSGSNNVDTGDTWSGNTLSGTTSGTFLARGTASVQGSLSSVGAITIRDTADWEADAASTGTITINGSGQISAGTISCTGITANNSAVLSVATITVTGNVTLNNAATNGASIAASGNWTLNSTSSINGGTSSGVNLTVGSSASIIAGSMTFNKITNTGTISGGTLTMTGPATGDLHLSGTVSGISGSNLDTSGAITLDSAGVTLSGVTITAESSAVLITNGATFSGGGISLNGTASLTVDGGSYFDGSTSGTWNTTGDVTLDGSSIHFSNVTVTQVGNITMKNGVYCSENISACVDCIVESGCLVTGGNIYPSGNFEVYGGSTTINGCNIHDAVNIIIEDATISGGGTWTYTNSFTETNATIQNLNCQQNGSGLLATFIGGSVDPSYFESGAFDISGDFTAIDSQFVQVGTSTTVIDYNLGATQLTDVCCGGGYLWAIDNASPSLVWKIAYDGTATSYTTGQNGLSAICYSVKDDTVYAVGNSYVVKLSATGSILWTQTYSGTSSQASCCEALGIDKQPTGLIWFIDQGTAYIFNVDTSGATVNDYPTAGTVTPIAITPQNDGNVWFTAIAGGTDSYVVKVTPDGTPAPTYIYGSTAPLGKITRGGDGRLWYFDSAKVLSKITNAGSYTPVSSAFANNPYALCAGCDGTIWFGGATEFGNIETTGSNLNEYNTNSATSMCAGMDGNIWFVNNNGHVYKFPLSLMYIHDGPVINGIDNYFANPTLKADSGIAINNAEFTGGATAYSAIGLSTFNGTAMSGGLLWFGTSAHSTGVLSDRSKWTGTGMQAAGAEGGSYGPFTFQELTASVQPSNGYIIGG